jgi:DNA-binding CsgD family transcriptional regulator
VLILLAKGLKLREAAETLGISETTAKTHLQHLFQKTDTQRQADLVRLVTSALAPAASRTLRGDSEFTSPILAA